MDWSLLDSLTWPMFIVQYLTTMRYAEGQEWKEFYVNVLEKDYYTLSAGRKLIVLQILCDGALDSAELRAEIDMREESEVGPDPDAVIAFSEPVKETPRRRGRPPKNPVPKDQEPVKEISTPISSVPKATGSYIGADVDEDGNVDECRLCGMDGILVCCDGCPLAYHSRCIGIMKMFMPEGAWYCPECTMNKIGPNVTKLTSLRGAAIFGIDPYEQVFLGSCNQLLVMKASRSSDSESHVRYYSPVDIQKVLHALTGSDEYKALYFDICKGILEHWEIPESIFFLPDPNEIDKMLLNKTEDIDLSAPSTALPTESSNGVAESTSKDVVAASISENGNCNTKSEMAITSEMTTTPLHTKEVKLPFSTDVCLYKGLSYKPQAYQNVYIHGDFAASAAASLAILSSEEKLGSQPQPSSSHRKFMSANYSLQIKAFLLAAKRFYWPNYEKKLVEVPRERCGWCFSCQVSTNSKKGCLLNFAASNAIKGPSKVLSSIRHSKNVEGSLASIATYVMFMEESLCGLTIGPFLIGNYRKQWCKKVEEATTLGEIKTALLEFEKNIRTIAFSADWIKLVDDMGFEKQVNTSAKTVVGSSQKRGPGRPGRKPAVIVPEVTDTDGKDASVDFSWWRGGMLSKHIFQKGILPQTMIKHAARLGGSGKLNGVQYVDGITVPKRSRQFVWRAGVEMCKTASQLALQVRYLDLHVRWAELVHPDQPVQEGKGPETEASAFRNALIVDKKVSGNKVCYGVVFENQKHLPSRVLKNVLEVEERGDNNNNNNNNSNKDKYWFLEMRIPLYLIKEYEMEKQISPNPSDKPFVRLQKKKQQFKSSSGKNIFSFLLDKRDNPGKCLCTLCQLDVQFRIAARCSACEGYCHEQCAIESSIQMEKHVEFLITCKRCYQQKYAKPLIVINGDSPTSPLLLQGQESQHSTTSIKVGKQNGFVRPNVPTISNQSSQKSSTPSQPNLSKSAKKKSKKPPVESVDQSSSKKVVKSSNGSSKKRPNVTGAKLTLGLIWKKKTPDETGIDFRLKNLLLKNNPNGHLLAPACHLCSKPYDSSLMYIHCEGCSKWFHADAVELKESTIMDLVGFKCCRCRRIRIPVCPYTDPETRRRLEAKKKPLFKKKTPESDSNSETNEEQVNDWDLDANSNTPFFDSEDAVNVHEEPKSLYSFPTFPMVDPVNDRNRNQNLEPDVGPGTGPVPKKLPVRRHVKSEKESENPALEPPTSYDLGDATLESSTPVVEWNVSTNGFEDDMMFDYEDLNYEDMEFEPQTYFSFNELLADDGGQGQPSQQPDHVGPPDPVDSANPDLYQMGVGVTYDEQEPMFSVDSGVDMMPCRVCSQADPCPDLYCQNCGLWIHQHCSPWDDGESPWSPETGWKCGNCREWR